jgi:hypothetical protein
VTNISTAAVVKHFAAAVVKHFAAVVVKHFAGAVVIFQLNISCYRVNSK